jgi:hypothetical protein
LRIANSVLSTTFLCCASPQYCVLRNHYLVLCIT